MSTPCEELASHYPDLPGVEAEAWKTSFMVTHPDWGVYVYWDVSEKQFYLYVKGDPPEELTRLSRYKRRTVVTAGGMEQYDWRTWWR